LRETYTHCFQNVMNLRREKRKEHLRQELREKILSEFFQESSNKNNSLYRKRPLTGKQHQRLNDNCNWKWHRKQTSSRVLFLVSRHER
jgi:hypothetical protein